MEKHSKLGIFWAWFVFFTQIPFVFWYATGKLALHPIVIMLPLAGLLNFKVEKRKYEGVGLGLVSFRRTVLLTMIFVGLSCIGWWIVIQLEGLVLSSPSNTRAILPRIMEAFLVDVFIIALWEEIINRGYIQTRLQAVWGIWGVVLTSLMFAALHVPSALLDWGNDILMVLFRYLETGLVGFSFGYAYWRSRSVITSITMHGLNNFVITGILPIMSGISTRELSNCQHSFQILWLVGQIVLTVFITGYLFEERGGLMFWSRASDYFGSNRRCSR